MDQHPNGAEANGSADHMLVRLGRRKTDVTIIFEWAVKRGLIKCNVAYVQGVYLEEIPSRIIPKGHVPDASGRAVPNYEKVQMGMVLVKREWGNKLFFMNERQDWNEDDYFEAAELLMQQRRDADKKFEAENE